MRDIEMKRFPLGFFPVVIFALRASTEPGVGEGAATGALGSLTTPADPELLRATARSLR